MSRESNARYAARRRGRQRGPSNVARRMSREGDDIYSVMRLARQRSASNVARRRAREDNAAYAPRARRRFRTLTSLEKARKCALLPRHREAAKIRQRTILRVLKHRFRTQTIRLPVNNTEAARAAPPRIREVHCRVGRQTTDDPPDNGRPSRFNWMPPCFDDLLGDAKMSKVSEMHRFLESMCPRTCDLCRSRWFSPTMRIPCWANSPQPATLTSLCVRTTAPGRLLRGEYRCGYCDDDPHTLSAANEMSIGPSFPELDCLTEIESMLAAIYHPLTQIWTLRTGQAAYRGHVVNLEQRAHKFFANLPPRRPNSRSC